MSRDAIVCEEQLPLQWVKYLQDAIIEKVVFIEFENDDDEFYDS